MTIAFSHFMIMSLMGDFSFGLHWVKLPAIIINLSQHVFLACKTSTFKNELQGFSFSILAKTRFNQNSRNSIFPKRSICDLPKTRFFKKFSQILWSFEAKTSRFSLKIAKFWLKGKKSISKGKNWS